LWLSTLIILKEDVNFLSFLKNNSGDFTLITLDMSPVIY
jgi:hypothetical protein